MQSIVITIRSENWGLSPRSSSSRYSRRRRDGAGGQRDDQMKGCCSGSDQIWLAWIGSSSAWRGSLHLPIPKAMRS
jgi:hypothetical protein